MKFLKKAVVAAAAMSLVAAPVAASAAPANFDGLRADTELQNEFAQVEDGGGWILLLLAGLAIIAGIVAAAGGASNAPTSP